MERSEAMSYYKTLTAQREELMRKLIDLECLVPDLQATVGKTEEGKRYCSNYIFMTSLMTKQYRAHDKFISDNIRDITAIDIVIAETTRAKWRVAGLLLLVTGWLLI